MSRGPARLAIAIVIGLGVNAGSAGAVGLGSPGMVASIAVGGPVRVWDPVQAARGDDDGGWKTIAAKGLPAQGEYSGGTASRPQWSPDGTRLVFTESEADPGDPIPELGHPQQTSIWMYTVASGAVTRLTTPNPNLVDKDPDDNREVGHIVNDYAPTFSPDGQTVAFIRNIQVREDDELRADGGMQVWTVGIGGGNPSRRTNLGRDSVLFMLDWIPGTQELLAA